MSSEDEELQLAIAMSLGQEPARPTTQNSSHPPASPQPPTTNETGDALGPSPLQSGANIEQRPSATNPSSSFATIDRKQMEMERLARQNAARKRALNQVDPNSDDDKAPNTKKARGSGLAEQASSANLRSLESFHDVPREPAYGIRRNLALANSTPTPDSTSTYGYYAQRQHHTSTGYAGPNATGLRYLNPTIKKTWCFGQPRGNDVKIEEILQKDKLQLVALSAFQFDTAWWMNKIDPSKTSQVWAIGATDQAMKDSFAEGPSMIPNLAVRFLDMSGIRTINHGKFLILSFPTHLRVVVTSANLTDYDWGERGNMENSVFLVDLPRLLDGHTTSEENMTFFGKELIRYLRYVDMRPAIVQSLYKFDFSRTRDIAFVHSMAGTHVGDDAQRTGITGLSHAVKKLGLQTNFLKLDYATSSLGALKKTFLTQMLAAARGQEVKPLTLRNATDISAADLASKFRVYFPTQNTVESSRGGPNAASTITLMKKFYDAPTFPKEVMHDHKSTREGVLSHNKIMLARGRREDDGDRDVKVAWVYVGSANLTESAWGSMTTDRETRTPKLTVRNYECGVLIPVPRELAAGKGSEAGQVPDFGVFDGTLAIPFTAPGARYDGQAPWIHRSTGF
ncbi:tyrosyl-DNA phosphodiesterase-domain-containing protein [Phyllosticta citribraziliensis]|uniref:Tyrosyl-DNA phosphodiesterase-domain-containing protein n=1 Tax=Phyllosticta citribraziliensis TaxID=989973 RepID=A0ABR1L365_9PEZI